jgi:hypothetical protein
VAGVKTSGWCATSTAAGCGFRFCVIRVQLARSEWTLAGGLMCLVGRSRLIKINNGDKINNDTCERPHPRVFTA